VIAPFSGPFAMAGEEMKKAIDTVTPPGITVIYEDDACDNKTAISAFKKLTELDDVHFMIGPPCGAPQETLAPMFKDLDVLTLLASAATSDLYAQSGGDKMFQMQYALQDEAKFLADEMYKRGYERVAVIGYNNVFSKMYEDFFISNFKGEITDKIIISDIGAENISTALLKLKESKPEAIMNVDASFYFDSGVRKVRELGITVPIFSQYATEIPGIPELAEGVIYSFPGELSEGPNAIYSLALDTAKFLFPIVLECEGDYDCVREGLINSGEFNDKGVKNRTIILKQIVNGQGVVYE